MAELKSGPEFSDSNLNWFSYTQLYVETPLKLSGIKESIIHWELSPRYRRCSHLCTCSVYGHLRRGGESQGPQQQHPNNNSTQIASGVGLNFEMIHQGSVLSVLLVPGPKASGTPSGTPETIAGNANVQTPHQTHGIRNSGVEASNLVLTSPPSGFYAH